MCKIYGYARISTKKQSIDRQITNIKKEYSDAEIYSEAYTGTKTDRPEWGKLLKVVKTGDTIVFDSVSRMSRNAEEGVKQYFELYERGVVLVFLKEGYINTEVFESTSKQMIPATGNDIADIYIEATNKVIKLLAEKQIAKAFEQAQKEVDDLHVRTSEGMKARHASEKISRARTGNTYVTAKSKEMKGKIKKMAKCYDGTMTDKEVMETLKLAKNTYYKYKREIDAEMQ